MALRISYELASNQQIRTDLGEKLASQRLAQNITQEQLAERSGVSLRTLKRLEKGENSSIETLVKVMSGLQLLANLEQLIPAPTVRPMERIQQKGKERQRARPIVQEKDADTSATWSWGDEQ